jgi:hypothetical protein
VAAVALLLPLAVLLVRCQIALSGIKYWHVFDQYLKGGLEPVFQARLLMGVLIGVVWSLIPGPWFPEHVNVVLQVCFVWVGLWATWAYARNWLPMGYALAAAILAGFWLEWGMLPMGFSISYPYDLPAFALSALGVLALRRGDFWGLAAIVAFGTLNKETMVWLVAACVALQLMRRPAPRLGWLRVFALAAICAAVYSVARLAMVRSGGPLVTATLYEDVPARITRVEANVRELLTLRHGLPSENVYWFALLFVPVAFLWRRLEAADRALWLGAAALFVANFICGNIWEVRIFNEIVPLGAVAWVLAIRLWTCPADAVAAPADTADGERHRAQEKAPRA